ncbi:histidine kinase [Malaciobacter mytili LMG 24559]|uniref:histidine kinase n=1 Tax=Malaciobacter mytili LMG 24559 TaxID=1032238 RepID=A0AAX2ADW1_9BACT|nr:HAMP domain-containing sensor histidine kinase [Malaciobacter mytili]AXH15498.1 two-component system sensor histidine kinase [Malaciobacter mytili LMG 24559]RXK15182.1 histidine kinase [Malaciobacter mytili LMG 24559]
MKLIKKTNIKFKLGVLFFILCASIAVLGYKSINISEQNKETLKVVHSKSQTVLSLQDRIITPLYRLREISQSLVMAPNGQIRVDIEKNLNILITKLDKEFETFSSSNIQLVQMWKNYKNLIEDTKKYLKEEFEEGAYVNVTTSSRMQFHLLVNTLLEMQSKSLNNATLAYNEAVLKSKEIKIEIIASLVIILLFAIVVGWFITSNIINSIYIVQKGLSDFFNYLNHRKKKVEEIKLNTKDEFYQMTTMINQNVANIQRNIEQNEALIKNATKVLQNIKGGNLGTRLSEHTNNKALNELKSMINNMIDNLEIKIQEEISKRLEQEQLLIQQSKLASMGEMIGNIAHQWRQPLAQISAIHMNMKVTYDFNKFTKEYLDTKIKEANKLTSYMSQTISDFQNFFKPQGEKEEFSIQKACQEAYFIVESSLKYHGIEVSFDIKEDINVFGYKNEYSQVILNILSNAKDILLERQIENPKINIEIKNGENYAIVKIHDNAGGIKENIIDKIFDPYFTTRYKTQGTGIGLYMSKNIIERNMNGYINVKNVDNGALFTIKVAKN